MKAPGCASRYMRGSKTALPRCCFFFWAPFVPFAAGAGAGDAALSGESIARAASASVGARAK